jgi:hypothetical protein
MRNIFLIIICVAFVGCSEQRTGNFATPEIKNHFAEPEIVQLERIVSFVDSIILANTGITDINDAYHNYLDSVLNLMDKGEIGSFSLGDELRFPFFESLDNDLFYKIWTKGVVQQTIRSADTIITSPKIFAYVEMNSNSTFVDYLKDLGNTKEKYNHVYNEIKQAGTISPTIFAKLFSSDRNYDFTDSNERLWAAVFLLTWDEDSDTKSEKYLKNLREHEY